ncbi:MAG: NADH:flavin oxidoreductase [Proteobacteria bacterium]|nr:NADH:flavin oxidoreductase [Pseudomonadota bacterium]
MNELFESTEINGMALANRFVRSATWEGMATEEGECTPELCDLMARLAKGGVGLIITGHAYVRRDGPAAPWQLGVYDDRLIEGLRDMTRAVHDQGGRIVLQMTHAGLFANPKLSGETPVAVSQVDGFVRSPRKEMDAKDVKKIVEGFGHGARRAREAGFDGVQIHAAHGYLLSQFLSPVFNKRSDGYGGSVENRARALVEVLGRIKVESGHDFPALVKMNCEDFLDGGLSLNDSLKVGAMLQAEGIDAIELSGGTFFSGKLAPSRVGIKSEDKEAYFREAAEAFKKVLEVPLILVGGVRSFHVAEQLVKEGVTDYISMSRPLIREPGLVKRWASGDLRKAACLSDNQCFEPATAGEGIYCVVEKKEKR